MIKDAVVETFAEHVNSKFQLSVEGCEPVEVELISVTDLGSSERQIQFSLIFLLPPQVRAAQNLYQLKHDKLGEFDLFMVPIAHDQRGLHLEAVINRFAKQENS